MAKRKGPSAKAKKKYYGLVKKSAFRLRNVLRKHDPKAYEDLISGKSA